MRVNQSSKMLSFSPVYLRSAQNNCISSWSSSVDGVKADGTSLSTFPPDTLVLPSLPPSPLTINFVMSINGVYCTSDSWEMEAICEAIIEGNKFWHENLLYSLEMVKTTSSSLVLQLTCKLWNRNKISTLLEKPIALRPHARNALTISYMQRLAIKAEFFTNIVGRAFIESMITQTNEYLSSLIFSQLDFKLPLVFSTVARNRLKIQEGAVGPISYTLTKSSALMPTIVKIISQESTATTAYQLLQFSRNGHKTKFIDFQILRRKP